MGQPGIGVMLGMLGGNRETVEAVRGAIGRTVKAMIIDGGVLRVDFEDGTHLKVWDDGQSCCESRYMRTDDNLDYHEGATLRNIELRDAPTETGEYGDEHEVQFLLLTTSKGVLTISNHNEHNGYYGGFWIQAEGDTAKVDGNDPVEPTKELR